MGCLRGCVTSIWTCKGQQLPLSNSDSLTEPPLLVSQLLELHTAARQEPCKHRTEGNGVLAGEICSPSLTTRVSDRTLPTDAQCCLLSNYGAMPYAPPYY